MTDSAHISPRVTRALMAEDAIYGLILVSAVLVASGTADATALQTFVNVFLTVIVFFAAHVYAGALARLAGSEGASGFRASIGAAAKNSSGMLLASVAPLVILLLGTTRVIEDDTALWVALIADTLILAALGWVAVARWSTHWLARLVGAAIAAGFGGALYIVKVIVGH
ncbi:hypothetical protein ABCS02_32005 [Microbacterium sp. X-17]|uniref:hypothetical protein n=1 Tax=Microbacterium sp. X-17 TaxID=3144404 RepID=UPI0031F57FDC